ncbi:MAG: PLP-dependent aspartate aminotransferase family protein [Fimbriimonadaceae bacterium]|nr:PLP-dependent aspartate aminotransferase family protein [Fimbriimonadaceae bacterium]
MNEWSLETKVVALGSRPDPLHGSVTVPIYQTSTFAQTAPGEFGLYDYTRTDNPTRTVLQEMLAALEGSRFALAYASGMAAEDCVLSLFRPGDHILTSEDAYGGTYRYLMDVASARGLECSFADLRNAEAVRAAIRPNTKLIWFETPTNPLMSLVDIRQLTGIAKEHGILTCLDNTFAGSWNQQALPLGVDIIMHSGTKYINGHSDVTLGCLMLNDEDLYGRLKHLQNALGPTCSPFDCWLAIRGLKTYALRMRAHEVNSLAVARFLESHPNVEQVIHPGLESHPDHELAKRQMSGFGGMVSMRVRGGLEEAKKVLCGTKLFTLAVSLGGVESLIEQPATMTHFEMPKETRERIGITDNFVRLSIGIESADDLIADLDAALRCV